MQTELASPPLPSRIEIDLKQIQSNFDVMRAFTKPGTKATAVIKANGYGHGAVELARFLKNVDYFAVATVSEAVELRNAGIITPIMVLSAVINQTVPYYLQYDLTAIISDIEHFDLLEKSTKAHIQFDTGMYRFGILPERLSEVLEKTKSSPLNIHGILTHFAKSGDPGESSVYQQLSIFKEIRSHFPADWITHAANTGGIAFYPESHFDMIRVGVSLYGYGAGETQIGGIKPVCKWKTDIIQVKPVKKGIGIGYNWTYKAPTDGFVHVIPVGYADGYVRGLGNKITVKIDDQYVPVVGRITMDYALLFSTIRFSVGTEVEIMGEGEHSAAHWAAELGTIPYEILTRMGERRVERIFLK
jgi:alanine racemase